MPTVSVLIPNYNHAPFLQQRIDSILAQTFQDFEIIILDDCSTDNSKEIIEKYRNNPKISHIIYNETNSGTTFKQWEKGIKIASSNWIWIAESDDWCEPLLLEKLILPLVENPHLSISFCQSYIHIPDEKILVTQQVDKEEQIISKEDFFTNYLLRSNSIYNASMAVFNKNLFLEITSKEYMNYKFCGDWIFWAEMSLKGDVFRTSLLLNHYRKTGSLDVTSKANKLGLNYIENIKALQYFKFNFKCDNVVYLSELKRNYFNFKRNKTNISTQDKKNITNQLEGVIGKKRMVKWDLQYLKNKLLEKFNRYIK